MSIARTARVDQQFTTTTATISAATSGNTLVLRIVALRSPSARTVSSLSCTNVTWTKLCGTTNGTIDVEIWYGVVAGGSSGTSITITMSATGATICGSVDEISGTVVTGTINDGTGVTNTGTSTSPTTGAFSASLANDFLIALEGHANGTTPSATPGGSWTDSTFSNNSTTVGCRGAYQLHGTTGSKSASWTIGNLAWVTCIGAIKVLPLTQTLTASMATMSGSTTKQPRKSLTASLATMAATITKLTKKTFNAS
jgi:hypothetical protein